MRRKTSILILFGTLLLLVLPSVSTLVTAGSDSGHYPIPPGIKEGDIVLIRWAHNISLFYSGLTYHHSLLYIGKINGVPRVIDADVPEGYPNGRVLNETWDDAMSRTYQEHGIEKLVVVRLNDAEPDPENSPYSCYAVQFADERSSDPMCHYDFWSQYNFRKQVKEQPDPWWADVLPPEGYRGPPHDDSWWMSRFSGYSGRDYYCNELIWAAYFETNGDEYYHHYIEKNPDPYAIRGWEIEHAEYGQVQLISGTPSGDPLAHDDD